MEQHGSGIDWSVPEQPNVVSARAPWDLNLGIRLFAPPSVIRPAVYDNWNARVGQYLALVHGWGEWPGLTEAYALFRGLRRPFNESADEEHIYTYVSKPRFTYGFPGPNDGALVKSEPSKESVFVVWAEIGEKQQPLATRLVPDAIPLSVQGIIIGWEWTRAATGDPPLPKYFGSRYKERVW